MGEPFQLPDGTVVSNYDANVIEVSGPGGGVVRVARHAAPPALQQAVSQAESGAGPQSLVRSAPAATPSPFANIDPNTPAPGVSIPQSGPAPASALAPAAPDLDAPMAPQQPANPMAMYNDEIARRRALEALRPQGSGAATRTAMSRTALPAEAAAEVRDMQTPIDEAVAEQQLAVESQADVEERALGDVSKLHAQQGQRIEQELNDQQTLRSGYEERFAAEQQKLADLNQRAQVEIDPEKYWKDKGTGSRILAAISMAMGAFVHARSEGRVQNTPQQLIQAAIERDIGSQVENRNRAERDVGRQAGIIGLLGDKYSDDLQKRQAALVLANEAVAKQIDGISAGMQSEQAKAKAAQLSASIRQANAQRAQEFTAQIAGSETTQTQSVSGGAGGAKRNGADALSAAVYGPGAVYDAKTYIPASVSVMDGEHWAGNTAEEAAAIRKKAAAVQELVRMSMQMEDIAKRGGKMSPQASRELDTLRAAYVIKSSRAEELGALDVGTTDIVKEQLGAKGTDVTTMTNTLPLTRQTLRAGFRASIQNQAHRIDPTTIPLAQRGGVGGASGGRTTEAPATRALAEETP